MAHMTYAKQIKHPKWQKKRLQVLELNNFTCRECCNKEQELHVHHPYYIKGNMAWEYSTEFLQCLCSRCHKRMHDLDDLIKVIMSKMMIDDKEDFIESKNPKVEVEEMTPSLTGKNFFSRMAEILGEDDE